MDAHLPASGQALRLSLGHVYWLGGGSGAGKSTLARRLADQHGMRLYSTDAVMAHHAERCAPQDAPQLAAFIKMDMDTRWLNRSPAVMLETFHWFHGEAFGLIVEDLLSFPSDQPVVVEGLRLLPRLVKPLLPSPRQAAWLVPTPRFRRAAFESRGDLMTIAGKTSDPLRALDNLLQRDAMFTDRLEREASEEGLSTLTVDGRMSIEDLARHLTLQFNLGDTI